MRLATTIFGLIVLGGSPPSFAGDLAPGIVAVGESLFLAPGQSHLTDDYWTTAEAPTPNVFLMLNKDWLARIRDDDPLLGPHEAELEIMSLGDGQRWPMNHTSEWDFASQDDVPEQFRLEGFHAQTEFGFGTPTQIKIWPIDSRREFFVTCFGSNLESGIIDVCDLRTSYPPDRALTLEVSMRRTRPFQDLAPEFDALVGRVREIAGCLDVSASPPNDPEAALATLLAENPMLQGCGIGLTS